MSLTKQDIDALVDKVTERHGPHQWAATLWRSELYLAAGLTATGERKPERVRAWVHEMGGEKTIQLNSPLEPDRHGPPWGCTLTPGWFVPDRAE